MKNDGMLQVIHHILKAPKCSTQPLMTIDDLGSGKQKPHELVYLFGIYYLYFQICVY